MINELMKPNGKIILGVVWFVIAMIYITDKLMNDLTIRLFDWIGWIAMFSAGMIFIIEGLKSRKNNIR